MFNFLCAQLTRCLVEQPSMQIHNLFQFFLNLLLIIRCLHGLAHLVVNLTLKLLQFRFHVILICWFRALNERRLLINRLIHRYLHFLFLSLEFEGLHCPGPNLEFSWCFLRANTLNTINFINIQIFRSCFWDRRCFVLRLPQSTNRRLLKRLLLHLPLIFVSIITIHNRLWLLFLFWWQVE